MMNRGERERKKTKYLLFFFFLLCLFEKIFVRSLSSSLLQYNEHVMCRMLIVVMCTRVWQHRRKFSGDSSTQKSLMIIPNEIISEQWILYVNLWKRSKTNTRKIDKYKFVVRITTYHNNGNGTLIVNAIYRVTTLRLLVLLLLLLLLFRIRQSI